MHDDPHSRPTGQAPASITGASALESLADQGYYFPLTAFSTAEAAELLQAYHLFCERVDSDPLLGALHAIHKPHLLADWADRIVHSPEILNVVERVLGPDLLVWSMDVFRRPPRESVPAESQDVVAPRGLEWHQDSLYMRLEPLDQIVRVWLALTPTTLANGTMRYLRGSHLQAEVGEALTATVGPYSDRGPAVDYEVDPESIEPVLLLPGQFAMHDIRTVHDSGINTTDQDRVSIAVTLVTPHVHPGYPDSALLVRGDSRGCRFEMEERLREEMSPRSQATFLRAISLRLNQMHADGIMNMVGAESPYVEPK